jgi:signal transduction histidine kinase
VLPRLNHRWIFASAILLLLVCGSALAWMLDRIYSSEEWVRHGYKVQLLIADIGAEQNKTGRVRQTYLETGAAQYLQDIEQTRAQLYSNLAQLKSMVRDNADQEQASQDLERAISRRFVTFEASIQLFQSGASTMAAQEAYTQELVRLSLETSSIARNMQDAEANLLNRRLSLTGSIFIWIIVILAATYFLSVYMLWEHYRVLSKELAQRIRAERNALNLSAQLLNAQDQERRRIARELHDGLGQNLAAAKMIADSLLARSSDRQQLQDLSAILHDAVSSTRSISHLLHPPLVDELGFVSAARSYLEGFSRRTGVQVQADLPDSNDRLPRDLELTLFRVLQEALTNIQRHSKSSTAEVQFRADARSVSLQVRDHGVGLPAGTIQNFNENGSSVGVGLAGMKERVRERHGRFEIRSDSAGTFISATFPIVPDGSAGQSQPSNGQ